MAAEAMQHLILSLGWSGGSLDHLFFSVKMATAMQPLQRELGRTRHQRVLAMTSAALAAGPTPPGQGTHLTIPDQLQVDPSGVDDLLGRLKFLWNLPMPNMSKEPLWRLLINGLRGRHCTGLCPCGWTPPPHTSTSPPSHPTAESLRFHQFWSCPVAAAVMYEIQKSFPLNGTEGSRYRPTCKDLWLLTLPSCHDINPEVWQVVCMAAIASMEEGRKALWRLHRQGSVAPPDLVTQACRVASTSFWSFLQDVITYSAYPTAWASLRPAHPFIGGFPLNVILPIELQLPGDL
jgi:hypothetical protein